MAHRLAVVILHYGAVDLTARLRDQLRASDPTWPDLFVLDNNAPEPFAEAWERLPQNRYWAGALDHAARRLGNEGFSHLWFLNNDIRFVSRPPFLAMAWGRLQRLERTLGRVGVYSPSALQNPYHPQMVQDPRRQYRRVRCVDGIAPLLNLECLRARGLDYDGNAYGYGVDVAMTMAAHDAGWPVVVDHQVCVKHAYHTTANAVPGFMDAARDAEAAYMRRVLGHDWRDLVAQAQTDFTDHDAM